MAHARRFACSLLAVALLSGCDIAGKIPLTPQEALRAADKFGLTTRERLEETAEGTTYRLMVESNRSANWLEADRKMWADLGTPCPEGQLHDTVATQPKDTRQTDGDLASYPANTLFVRTVRCAPKFPFEFDLAADISDEDAHSAMYRTLAAPGPNPTRQPMIAWLFADKFQPRYRQMQNNLAIVVHMRLADCPDGVAIRNLTLGVRPPTAAPAPAPDKPGELPRNALFGFTTECVAPQAAPEAAPAVPGS